MSRQRLRLCVSCWWSFPLIGSLALIVSDRCGGAALPSSSPSLLSLSSSLCARRSEASTGRVSPLLYHVSFSLFPSPSLSLFLCSSSAWRPGVACWLERACAMCGVCMCVTRVAVVSRFSFVCGCGVYSLLCS